MEWNLVENLLPALDKPVLIFTNDARYLQAGKMLIACLTTNGWQANNSTISQVTHWLPLPDLPFDKHFEAIKAAADCVMSQYIPEKLSISTFTFSIMAEGKQYIVKYSKDAGGYWQFMNYA